MREISRNLWDCHGQTAIGITTGGQVSRRGECIMLRGCVRRMAASKREEPGARLWSAPGSSSKLAETNQLKAEPVSLLFPLRFG